MNNSIRKIQSLLSNSNYIDPNDDDISYFMTQLDERLKVFNDLTANRKIAIITLCFLYGIQGLMSKTNLMLALEQQDYDRVCDELLKQDNRFKDIANALKSDIIEMP